MGEAPEGPRCCRLRQIGPARDRSSHQPFLKLFSPGLDHAAGYGGNPRAAEFLSGRADSQDLMDQAQGMPTEDCSSVNEWRRQCRRPLARTASAADEKGRATRDWLVTLAARPSFRRAGAFPGSYGPASATDEKGRATKDWLVRLAARGRFPGGRADSQDLMDQAAKHAHERLPKLNEQYRQRGRPMAGAAPAEDEERSVMADERAEQ
jgi:hypothetical protein